MSSALEELESTLQQAVGCKVIGMQRIVRALTVAIVARGHVLIQGAPGLGKTLLSKTLAQALAGRFKRIQGTADLMPSDITGVHVYEGERQGFVFHPGPLFADVLLFDEINRTGPKTQSALLEAMQERQVSVDRRLYALPAEFLVIATQNPRDFEGTFPLPESQLDRFMLRLQIDYPDRAHELDVLARYGSCAGTLAGSSVNEVAPAPASNSTGTSHSAVPNDSGRPQPAVTPALLSAARAQIDALHVAPALSGYVLDLAQASREDRQLSLGLSTRGALALLRAARVEAGLRRAQFVTPDDVKTVWPWVVPHRLVLSSEALLEGTSEQTLAARLLERVAVPR
jgi:MoxR-like ATPase